MENLPGDIFGHKSPRRTIKVKFTSFEKVIEIEQVTGMRVLELSQLKEKYGIEADTEKTAEADFAKYEGLCKIVEHFSNLEEGEAFNKLTQLEVMNLFLLLNGDLETMAQMKSVMM